MEQDLNIDLRCFAAVDLSAIDHNLTQLAARLPAGVKKMAVVKADAYGHGSVPVSLHIETKVDAFAVAALEEAMELREAGIKKDILILAYTGKSGYRQLIENDITATIYSWEDALALSDTAVSLGKKAKIHIAVDTGMGRIGFFPTEESADVVAKIATLPEICLEGMFSHYACADMEDKKQTLEQLGLFDAFIAMLENRGVHIPVKHISNSAGTLDMDRQYDMCRLGIVLYGLYPSEEVNKGGLSLRPAMEVASHVIHVKTVEPGCKIGYGHTYTAPTRQRIATVSIGYADGYSRGNSGKGYVLIRGKKAPVVGRVCMDLIMVDVTHIPDVQVADLAVILGSSGDAVITAEELASLIGTINYEVICTLMPRVKRVYYRDGEQQ